jgi:phage replication-related protein YjqB (UPF0714/DUF867 family)
MLYFVVEHPSTVSIHYDGDFNPQQIYQITNNVNQAKHTASKLIDAGFGHVLIYDSNGNIIGE